MARNEGLIIGLDIGTTKVCVIVAERTENGVDIVGIGTHPSKGLRKGVVVDIDATIAQQLRKNRPGMLIHDFPDGLSENGWLHNQLPMKLAEGQRLYLGKPSRHPRQQDGRSKP